MVIISRIGFRTYRNTNPAYSEVVSFVIFGLHLFRTDTTVASLCLPDNIVLGTCPEVSPIINSRIIEVRDDPVPFVHTQRWSIHRRRIRDNTSFMV